MFDQSGGRNSTGGQELQLSITTSKHYSSMLVTIVRDAATLECTGSSGLLTTVKIMSGRIHLYT